MRKKIAGMFEGDYKVVYHLAPPLLAKTDRLTGEPKKIRFGPWMGAMFKVLAALKGLRGTSFDVFGYTAERRMERGLIAEYEADVEKLLARLSLANHSLAVQIASLPEDIRGFGHIKTRNVAATRKKRAELLGKFENTHAERAAA
jgi:indolepyruvate ferredoxin oxidoreductase